MSTTAAQKQDFIGSLVGSILIKKGVDLAINKGMQTLGKAKNISLEKKDEAIAGTVIKQQIREELTDQIVHKTNAEPIIKSRVAQGSALAAVTAVVTIWRMWTDNVIDQPEDFVAPLTVIVGTAWALYGRFIAKKAFWS